MSGGACAVCVQDGQILITRNAGQAERSRVQSDLLRIWREGGIYSNEAYLYALDRERLIDEARD